jgi:hypothetical protein
MPVSALNALMPATTKKVTLYTNPFSGRTSIGLCGLLGRRAVAVGRNGVPPTAAVVRAASHRRTNRELGDRVPLPAPHRR